MGYGKCHKGKYTLKKPKKYLGDPKKVMYRSSLERSAFIWCENNPKIKRWNSEELVVSYRCLTDRRIHRYFVDLWIEWVDGTVTAVEIKPEKQTRPPTKPKRKTKKTTASYLGEQLIYAKNISKWEAASHYCKKQGWKFEIWTESILKSKGVMVIY